jgi:hypothetical protein
MNEQIEMPIHWEMIKLAINPPPNATLVRKMAIIVSNTKV